MNIAREGVQSMHHWSGQTKTATKDTGKRMQLSCLGVPAWLTYSVKRINSINHSFIYS